MTPAYFGIEPVGVYTDVSEQGNPLSELKLYTESDMQKYAREVAKEIALTVYVEWMANDAGLRFEEILDEVMGEKS